ncbi:MAG: hypothetical protein KTR31_25745 [Myxococcales bacterium]|nr:hypothetical protein [Myxococcales bacterium]
MLFPLLVACDLIEPPEPITLITDLRVVTSIFEPPEVGVGDLLEVTTYVANPLDVEYDLLIWTCTPTGQGCWEQEIDLGPLDLQRGFRRRDPNGEPGPDGRPPLVTPVLPNPWVTTFQIPGTTVPLSAPFIDLDASALVYVLVCEAGTCPIMDLVESRSNFPVIPGEPRWTDLYPLFERPDAWFRELPSEGTHLAVRQLGLTTRDDGRNANPSANLSEVYHVLSDRSASQFERDAQVGETLLLRFTVTDDNRDGVWAHGLTSGGFVDDREPVKGGSVDVEFVAPDTPGCVRVWVQFEEDHSNGAALFTGAWNVSRGEPVAHCDLVE